MQFVDESAVVIGAAGILACGVAYVRTRRRRGGQGAWRAAVLLAVMVALGFATLLEGLVCWMRVGIARREWDVSREVRLVVEAERTYAQKNGGYFDDLECLALTRTACAPAFDGPALVPEKAVPSFMTPRGYRRTFHPGSAAPGRESGGAVSRSSVVTFAYTATPMAQVARLAFCGDSTGRLCYSWDTPPGVTNGVCDPGCRVMTSRGWLEVYVLRRRSTASRDHDGF